MLVRMLAVALCLLIVKAGFGTVLRVDATNGVDSGGCGSEANPCASIQQAVNNSTSGDEIRVAEGTYVYVSGVDPCVGETGVVCIVDKRLSIVGGYLASDWSEPDPAITVRHAPGRSCAASARRKLT